MAGILRVCTENAFAFAVRRIGYDEASERSTGKRGGQIARQIFRIRICMILGRLREGMWCMHNFVVILPLLILPSNIGRSQKSPTGWWLGPVGGFKQWCSWMAASISDDMLALNGGFSSDHSVEADHAVERRLQQRRLQQRSCSWTATSAAIMQLKRYMFGKCFWMSAWRDGWQYQLIESWEWRTTDTKHVSAIGQLWIICCVFWQFKNRCCVLVFGN